ncbi:MAG: DUF2933 domain-containing protein [Chloroflexi bacterium]|nr:DUF2933 domain-containing protein [Chloroflexota bacterium]
MSNIFGMCFNRNVLIGLGAIGLGLFIVAPQLALSALPLLLFLACPLSMVVAAVLMGRGMQQGTRVPQPFWGQQSEQASASLAPEERLRQLQVQFQQLQVQQATLAQQIAELEGYTGSGQEPALPRQEAVREN